MYSFHLSLVLCIHIGSFYFNLIFLEVSLFQGKVLCIPGCPQSPDLLAFAREILATYVTAFGGTFLASA